MFVGTKIRLQFESIELIRLYSEFGGNSGLLRAFPMTNKIKLETSKNIFKQIKALSLQV